MKFKENSMSENLNRFIYISYYEMFNFLKEY
jgi:hypothetical protein